MSGRGVFISFEGIDGAGKSTHIAALARVFAEAGRDVVQTREPGGTPLAEQLRALLLGQEMGPLTEALLMFAARRDHLDALIVPALKAGRVVLCDRFADATFAYQGSARGFDWERLELLERLVQGGAGPAGPTAGDALLQPDLTLWFDLPPAQAAQRLQGSRLPDKFERQPAAFFEAVRAGYARRAREHPQRFVRIDATGTVAQVWQAVQASVRARGWP
ncbi:MAG: dTMP kinase [Ottowia sp.]|nr:dTMP kinase [Ottowia sp.]